jgi:hypothetical protein
MPSLIRQIGPLKMTRKDHFLKSGLRLAAAFDREDWLLRTRFPLLRGFLLTLQLFSALFGCKCLPKCGDPFLRLPKTLLAFAAFEHVCLLLRPVATAHR